MANLDLSPDMVLLVDAEPATYQRRKNQIVTHLLEEP